MATSKNYDALFACPFGGIGLRLHESKIVHLDFIYEAIEQDFFATTEAKNIAQEITRYFSDSEHHFNVELELIGTPFQQRVWQQLRQIPAGQVLSYGDVAAKLNSSPRAVGNACRQNPIPIIVPCHRVVAKSGIGGFAGERQGQKIHLKEWLLEHERAEVC